MTIPETPADRPLPSPADEARTEDAPFAAWSELSDRLPGGAVIWIFIIAELMTFAAFFLTFAVSYKHNPQVFSDAQTLLHPGMGTINTAVLLTGSWFAARAVIANHDHKAAPWLFAGALSGIVFLAIKTTEYGHIFHHDISLSTNAFWFFYLFLTLMHYLHVIFGVGVMLYLGWYAHKGKYGPTNPVGIEAGAAYWHLVDLIWIVLFPIIYLMEVA